MGCPNLGRGFKSESPLNVTLVHGTFARETAWIKPNSTLRRHCEEQCPGGVEFTVFQWDGRNDFTSRRKAADGLLVHITRQIEEKPNANHWIIAHSHGGNIALMAGQHCPANPGLAGIICLATPFFDLRVRKGLRSFPSVLRWIAVFMASSYSFFIAAWLFTPSFRRLSKLGMPEKFSELLPWIYIFLGVLLCLALDFTFSGRFVKRLTQIAKVRAADFQFTFNNSVFVYSINATLDEVRIGLRFAYYLSQFSAVLLSWKGIGVIFFMLMGPLICAGKDAIYAVGQHGGFVPFAVNVYVIYPMALVSEFFIPYGQIDAFMPFVAVLMTLVTVATLASLSILLAMAVHYVATVVRFGWACRWKLFDTFMFDVDVKAKPPGVHNAVIVTVPISGLAHTTLYEKPDVLKAIVDALRSKL